MPTDLRVFVWPMDTAARSFDGMPCSKTLQSHQPCLILIVYTTMNDAVSHHVASIGLQDSPLVCLINRYKSYMEHTSSIVIGK